MLYIYIYIYIALYMVVRFKKNRSMSAAAVELNGSVVVGFLGVPSSSSATTGRSMDLPGIAENHTGWGPQDSVQLPYFCG